MSANSTTPTWASTGADADRNSISSGLNRHLGSAIEKSVELKYRLRSRAIGEGTFRHRPRSRSRPAPGVAIRCLLAQQEPVRSTHATTLSTDLSAAQPNAHGADQPVNKLKSSVPSARTRSASMSSPKPTRTSNVATGKRRPSSSNRRSNALTSDARSA